MSLGYGQEWEWDENEKEEEEEEEENQYNVDFWSSPAHHSRAHLLVRQVLG